jgi:hypothetical protein
MQHFRSHKRVLYDLFGNYLANELGPRLFGTLGTNTHFFLVHDSRWATPLA